MQMQDTSFVLGLSQDLKKYEAIDCCDDEDHGSALPILNLIQASEITFRAVYVVRKCGKKLNEQRIPMYLQAAKEVLQKYPENSITKKVDRVNTVDEGTADKFAKKTYAKVAASPPNYRGRGGLRGRGRGNGGRQRGGRGGRSRRTEDDIPKRTYIPKKKDELFPGSQHNMELN